MAMNRVDVVDLVVDLVDVDLDVDLVDEARFQFKGFSAHSQNNPSLLAYPHA